MPSKSTSKIFGATMLIAGTSIGAAMLALPVLTGLFGFLGTVAILFLAWGVMYWMALIIVEATLNFSEEVSFISLARKTLGRTGSIATWITFLLLFYALVAAYLSGCGKIIIDLVEVLLGTTLPPFFDLLPLLVLFAPFIYFGLGIVDQLNRVLMVGMLISYVVIAAWLLPLVNIDNLLITDWRFSLLSFSVVVTSFGFHVIIPTLATYLDRDLKKIKQSIFFGSLIPLLIYLLWEVVILGALARDGEFGLTYAYTHDIPLSKILRVQLESDAISLFAQAFSVFAIVTSFLGVAQGLYDFLRDGLNAHGNRGRENLAFLLTFLPPVLLVVIFQGGFLALLDYAGALVSIILGIIPILIVWRLRARGTTRTYRAGGGQGALILGLFFFGFVIALVLLKNLGVMNFALS